MDLVWKYASNRTYMCVINQAPLCRIVPHLLSDYCEVWTHPGYITQFSGWDRAVWYRGQSNITWRYHLKCSYHFLGGPLCTFGAGPSVVLLTSPLWKVLNFVRRVFARYTKVPSYSFSGKLGLRYEKVFDDHSRATASSCICDKIYYFTQRFIPKKSCT